MKNKALLRLAFCLAVVLPGSAMAQEILNLPTIQTFSPAGAKAGTTVDVQMRGSNLTGAHKLLVYQPGITGTVRDDQSHVDTRFEPVWKSSCGTCHELRSPANRDLSPQQWADTVHRMITMHQAPISPQQADQIIQYLQSAARATKVVVHIHIAPQTVPGIYLLRVVTPHGVSSAAPFEVGSLPEVTAIPSGPKLLSQHVDLPCVVNGCIAQNSELDRFNFQAAQGKRYVFDLKAFRYNRDTQLFFNPQLRLYDPNGNKIAENSGYYELDPLLDWTCPKTGVYILEVRDLLGHSNPASVYRLTMGALPYNTLVYPPAGRVNQKVQVQLIGQDTGGQTPACIVQTPSESGFTQVATPWGPQSFYVTRSQVVSDTASAGILHGPVVLTGRIVRPGQTDNFSMRGPGGYEFRLYASSLGGSGEVDMELLNAQGKVVNRQHDGERFDAYLPGNQTYTLRVTAPQADARRVYCVNVQPNSPLLKVMQRPDTALLQAGGSTAVELRVMRRQGIAGPITITASGLPAHVHAAPLQIAPDQYRAYLILTASGSAPAVITPFQIHAAASNGHGQTVTVRCIPQQPYKMIFSMYYHTRPTAVLEVSTAASFAASVTMHGPLAIRQHGGVQVPVHIYRTPGYSDNLVVRLVGLPNGWVADAQNVAPNQNEVNILVRPDGGNRTPFVKRNKTWPPYIAVVEVWDHGTPVIAATMPVTLAPPRKIQQTAMR